MDSNDLVMTDRNGVEIDYCPQCRGVWLDRGELDKIIDRAATQYGGQSVPPARQAPPAPTPPPHYNRDYLERPRYDDRNDRNYNKGYDRDYDRRKKKKEGWLGDLFDF
ncbi:zf-TFIIB domain-containing protein [Arthrobacter celericrescens]|uniref:TFIIB-type zinc ribbon-containing protein n=1 Tax=Arthrobacter celericrescens TaxID=2320851 RepID=UPI001FDEBB4C|nr:zf-TFIIB domain-containing protein [Arthrobacter celericrescens]